jgi:5-(carboxyamino)imidazole ribonucleotide synthase
MTVASPLPPGSVIGMLGAGQLGRMTALAAARLGYRVHVFAPDAAGSPTAQVCDQITVADWADGAALEAFAAAVDVVTLEWENVPVATVEALNRLVPVRPGAPVLAVAQDRVAEKSFANRLGVATAPWRAVNCAADVAAACAQIGPDCILKTTRMGYDGKGQVRLNAASDPAEAWAALGHVPGDGPAGIVEGLVEFEREISVIVARGLDGAMVCWPAAENIHKSGILDTSRAPARIPADVAAQAQAAAMTLAAALGVVGLLAVEMFITSAEAGAGAVLMNEMAPRPHNSGHWTQDGAATCQFEQLTRAVCGLPLGSAHALAEIEMENLIGDDVLRWPQILAEPNARLHLYGKAEARPGRKMGHVNRFLRMNISGM